METKKPVVLGLPVGVVTVLAAIAESKTLTDGGNTMAQAIVKMGLVEAAPSSPSGYTVTDAGRQRLAEVCKRCGRPLSRNGHCHPCIEDKLLLEKNPSFAISMRNAFGDDKT